MNESPERQQSLASAIDRRKAIRYACILEATWHGETFRLGEGWVARVLNISTGGIGLHLGEDFKVGTLLTLGLHGQVHTLEPVRVRVVHHSQKDDGTWILGGAFLKPLSEDELKRLLS